MFFEENKAFLADGFFASKIPPDPPNTLNIYDNASKFLRILDINWLYLCKIMKKKSFSCQ
jgi:hypothetical protein